MAFPGIVILQILSVFSVTTVANTQNEATFVAFARGTNVTLVCPTNVSYIAVQWYYAPAKCTGRNETPISLPKFQNDSKFLMQNSTNGSSLSINQIDIQDVGIYKCEVISINDTGESLELTFDVTVVVSVPTCDTERKIVQEYDNVQLSCSVTYCSHADPAIEWWQLKANGEQIANMSENFSNVTQSTTGKTITSFLITRASQHQQPFAFSCRMNFRPNLSTYYSSVNSSEFYNDTCDPVEITVHDGARNVTILPRKNIFHPGQTLTCSALGYPTPVIEWKNVETGEVTAESHITIIDSMIRTQNYMFRCTATNTLASSFSDIRFTVETNPLLIAIIAGTVGVAISLVVVLIVIILVHAKRRKPRRLRPTLGVRENVELNYYVDNPIHRSTPSYSIQTREEPAAAVYSAVNIEPRVPLMRNADGLEYMQMNFPRDIPSPTVPPLVPQSSFSMSVYASIDHTQQPSTMRN